MFNIKGKGGWKWAVLLLVILSAVSLLGACGSTDTSVFTPSPLAALNPTAQPSPVAALPNYSASQFGASNVTATLNGSGSTFAQPIYSQWFTAYKQVAPNVTINYVSDGSGNGRAAFLGTPVPVTPIPAVPGDFAGSDAPFSGTQYLTATGKGDLVHVPIALGGVALAYHLNGFTGQLRLSGTTLAAIYLGKINTWSDPAIAGDNPGVALPNKALQPVIRTRGSSSGTTEIFTRYLSVVSSDFRNAISTDSANNFGAPKWASTIQLQGASNDEIANQISTNDGSIGYIDLNAALDKKLNTVAIRNQTGRFIAPTVDSVTAAAAGVSIPDDFRIFVVNAEGENSYPIAGFTWWITWRDLGKMPNPSPEKAQAMANFIWWFIHSGQQSPNLVSGFAPLPSSLIPRLEALFINSDQSKVFQYNGKPIFTQPQ